MRAGKVRTSGLQFPDNSVITQAGSVVPAGTSTNLTASPDTYANQVALLINFDTATSITDTSAFPAVMTNYGVSTTPLFAFIGDACARFDGSTFLRAESSSDRFFRGGDFTVEFWFMVDAASGPQALVSSSVDHEFGIIAFDDKIRVYASSDGATWDVTTTGADGAGVEFISATTLAPLTWYNVALVRAGTTWTLFLNGSIDSQVTAPGPLLETFNPIDIGQWGNGGDRLTGYMDSLRITRFARYTADFSANLQTTPWPNCKATVTSGSLQYNKLGDVLGGTDNLVWNETDLRLGIGTPNPTEMLHLANGSLRIEGFGYGVHFADGSYQSSAAVNRPNTSDLNNDLGFQTASDVNALITNIVGAAPAALDTLQELATALGDDANFAGSVTTALSNKADRATTLAGYGITDSSKSFLHTFTDTDLSLGILQISHGLSSKYCQITIYDGTDLLILPDEVTATDSNTLTIDLTSFGTLVGTWHARIVS